MYIWDSAYKADAYRTEALCKSSYKVNLEEVVILHPIAIVTLYLHTMYTWDSAYKADAYLTKTLLKS